MHRWGLGNNHSTGALFKRRSTMPALVRRHHSLRLNRDTLGDRALQRKTIYPADPTTCRHMALAPLLAHLLTATADLTVQEKEAAQDTTSLVHPLPNPHPPPATSFDAYSSTAPPPLLNISPAPRSHLHPRPATRLALPVPCPSRHASIYSSAKASRWR